MPEPITFPPDLSEYISEYAFYKLVVLKCKNQETSKLISNLHDQNVACLNIGKELANFIQKKDRQDYLDIEIIEYLNQLFDKFSNQTLNSGLKYTVIYNLGILFEPSLNLNPIKLIKDFSRNYCLFIVWEDQIDEDNRLYWTKGDSDNQIVDFSGISIKIIYYEI